MKKTGILLFIILTALFLNCSKNTGSPSATYIRFLQAIPNTIINAGLNDNIMLASSVSYDSLTPYITLDAGAVRIQVSNEASGTNLIDAIFTISPGNYYTFIVADSVNKIKPTLLQDSPKLTDSTVNIRMLHLSDITGRADLANAADSVLSSGRSFNDQYISSTSARYVILKPGTFTLHLNKNFTDTLITPVPGFTYIAGKSYTLVLHNVQIAGGIDTAGVSVFTDN